MKDFSELTLTIRLKVKMPDLPCYTRQGAVQENMFADKVKDLIQTHLGNQGTLADGTRYVVESSDFDLNY